MPESKDPEKILQGIIGRYEIADKWKGSMFEKIKSLPNTNVGDVGTDFIEELARSLQFTVERATNTKGEETRLGPWDLRISGTEYEVKTATEDRQGNFQFNHIRHHRPYEALICLGISPSEIHFDIWSKADVSTGKAGKLVTMDKGSSATFKLTKKKPELRDIKEFKGTIDTFSEK